MDVEEIRDFFFISFCLQFWLSVLLSHRWKSVSEFGRFKSGRATTITAMLTIIIMFFSHLFIFITTKEKEETKSFKKGGEGYSSPSFIYVEPHEPQQQSFHFKKSQQTTTNHQLIPSFLFTKEEPKEILTTLLFLQLFFFSLSLKI